MRVEVLFDTHVGSETTWVRLKDDTTDKILKYIEVEGTKKYLMNHQPGKKLGELDIK